MQGAFVYTADCIDDALCDLNLPRDSELVQIRETFEDLMEIEDDILKAADKDVVEVIDIANSCPTDSYFAYTVVLVQIPRGTPNRPLLLVSFLSWLYFSPTMGNFQAKNASRGKWSAFVAERGLDRP